MCFICLGVKYESLNWILYIAYPITTVFGLVNSFAFIGFLWHTSKYQVLLVGVSNASYQVSAIMGNLLQILVQECNIKLEYGFLIFGAASFLGAIGCFFFVPSQTEYYERSSIQLKMHTEPPKESFFNLFLAAFKIAYNNYRLENFLFLLYIIACECFIQNYIGNCFYYFQALFTPDQSDQLASIFGYAVFFIAIVI